MGGNLKTELTFKVSLVYGEVLTDVITVLCAAERLLWLLN
jgi:hypothetical protein